MALRTKPARLIAGATCALALALGAGTAAGQEPTPPEPAAQPKLLGAQGFVVPAKKAKFRVGAIVVARYPSVDGELPERVRARLDVAGPDGSVIASARDRGSAPFRKNRNSYLFVHVMSFPREEGRAIVAATGKPSPRAIRLGVTWALRGQNGLGGSGSTGLGFARQPSVPPVVKSCPIGPFAQCEGANLKEANLEAADLRGAQLDGAHLGGANLNDANLAGADLQGANLLRARARHANLEDANAHRVNLNFADLSYANVSRLKLTSASVWNTNFMNAKYAGIDVTDTAPTATTCPDGSVAVSSWGNCWA